MSELYRHTLAVVRSKLQEVFPDRVGEFNAKTNVEVLRNPDDPANIFDATIEWPTTDDPSSKVQLRANFPGERFRDGSGYLGVTFSSAERSTAMRVDSGLKIRYGIGSVGLLEPVDAFRFEAIQGHHDRMTEPLWMPVSPHAAAAVLEQFGLTKQ